MTISSDANEKAAAAPAAGQAAVQHSATAREPDASLAAKQEMIEKLFRHTNEFLEQNKHDPLLVVEALAAILVRYTALFGPVEQMADRLAVLERLVGQECSAIQHIAQAQLRAPAAAP